MLASSWNSQVEVANGNEFTTEKWSSAAHTERWGSVKACRTVWQKPSIAYSKKNEQCIINYAESNCSQNRQRKMRKPEDEEVNIIMLEFFIKCRAQNIPMTVRCCKQRQRKMHQVCKLKNLLSAMVDWKRFGVGKISTSVQYVVNLPMLTKKSSRWLEEAPACSYWRICCRSQIQHRRNCRVLSATIEEVSGFLRGIM